MSGIQLVVTFRDHQIMYFPVPTGQSWKVNSASRCLVVGKGVPRIHVPLDSVLHFSVERSREVQS